ncbi:alpha/beta hydrolase [Pseudomaricurvus alkylphenolicus]|jgi:pimeloyl-ACP methyl ester carboxylesterase|uniref:alpha/beta fold hydrolase n=1 Tax=Pseudomaricurvus alkylphenolicus TaxID=1306991 RepID=UPI001422101A|nr:alpha/beta hydrolase [Pseudomaricurvus alkylphenolicus]NIB41673.1 alpha/beta hydrolase [Pseudomaricurvus alkylphenolicus]
MYWVLYALIIAIAIFAGLYFYNPRALFHHTIDLMRRLTGFQRKTLNVDGEQWYYLEGGASDSAVMVLVHGFGANKESWLPYARLLTSKYRVIIPDVPGFGESPQIMDKDYRSKTQADRLNAFLNRIGIDHCHISGNSMGGLIAARYTIAYPEQVDTLTLFNNAGIDAKKQTPFYEQMLGGEATLVIRTREEFQQLLSVVSHRPMKVPARFLDVIAEESIERAPLLDRIFASLKEEIMDDYLNQYLPDIRVPTLVLWGRQDKIFDYGLVNVMVEQIPDSHGVILESTGHTPMIERPADTARHQLHFLETRALSAGKTDTLAGLTNDA